LEHSTGSKVSKGAGTAGSAAGTSTGHWGSVSDVEGEGEEDQAEAAHTQRVATVLSHAAELKIPLRSVARAAERFEIDDLDRCVCCCITLGAHLELN
jgi:hypothetical protein